MIAAIGFCQLAKFVSGNLIDAFAPASPNFGGTF